MFYNLLSWENPTIIVCTSRSEGMNCVPQILQDKNTGIWTMWDLVQMHEGHCTQISVKTGRRERGPVGSLLSIVIPGGRKKISIIFLNAESFQLANLLLGVQYIRLCLIVSLVFCTGSDRHSSHWGSELASCLQLFRLYLWAHTIKCLSI